MLNTNADLTADQLDRLKEIYVNELVEGKSYEDLLDYVKDDYYQNVYNYSSLYGETYHGVFAEDIIFDFDEDTLNEWIAKVQKEVS